VNARDFINWSRAVNEMRYLHTEIDINQEMRDKYARLFDNHVRDYCRKKGIDVNDVAAKANPQPQEEAQEEEDEFGIPEKPPPNDADETKEIFRKIFKQLAMHLHPDRHHGLSEQEKEYRLETFKEAKKAFDDEKYFVLLDLTEKYKVGLPSNYKQQTRWMEKKIKDLKEEIGMFRGSFLYAYSECELDIDKERIVATYVKQIYGGGLKKSVDLFEKL
jgi:hypothetical protein